MYSLFFLKKATDFPAFTKYLNISETITETINFASQVIKIMTRGIVFTKRVYELMSIINSFKFFLKADLKFVNNKKRSLQSNYLTTRKVFTWSRHIKQYLQLNGHYSFIRNEGLCSYFFKIQSMWIVQNYHWNFKSLQASFCLYFKIVGNFIKSDCFKIIKESYESSWNV